MACRPVLSGVLVVVAAGTAQAEVNVSPRAWAFGDVMVGTETAARTITIAPAAGEQRDTVQVIRACPEVRIDLRGQTLPYDVTRNCGGRPPDECVSTDIDTLAFDVFFRPTIGATQTCLITIDLAEPAADIDVAVSGTGLPPPIEIVVAQPTAGGVDFGDVQGTSAAATVSVTSEGTGTLTIGAITPAGAGFALATGGPTALPRFASADYTVTCAPAAPGPITGTLSFTSDDPDEPTVNVPLACNGVTSPLDVAPSPARLPVTRVGTTSMMTIDVRNNSGVDVLLGAVTIEGAGLSILAAPPPGPLATLATAQVTVGFAPTADGDVAGTLIIAHDGTQTRRAAMLGPGRASILSVAPHGPIDLGPVCIGQMIIRRLVAIDSGTWPLVVTNPVNIVAAADYTIATVPPTVYPATLSPRGNGIIELDVTVAPTTAALLTAIALIDTDIPALPTRSVNVQATGLDVGVWTRAVDLGAARVGDSAGARPVPLSNCGPAPITITSHAIEGPDAADFMIVSAPATLDVAAGSTATWVVDLRPVSVGRKRATLSIVTSGGTLAAELTGEGHDPTGHGPPLDERGSYYACSAGSGAGGGSVILLALALRGRRPRPPVR